MEKEHYLSHAAFASLCEVITSFHIMRDMDEMLVDIFRKIKAMVAIEGASIALHDPISEEFYFIQTIESGLSTGLSGDTLRFPDDRGVAGWVLRHSLTAVSNDVSLDDRYYDAFDSKSDFTTRSMICIPLRTRKGFLGVLYALNKIHGSFTAQDQQILEIICETVAVSLENAKLFGELRDNVQLLEREKQLLLSQLRIRSGFEEIIGSSAPMRRMFELMMKVIDTPTSVLIHGETGTGKELVAKVIHYNGPLRDKPFVVENCSALPENLLESELFGHVRGAFTGAVSSKQGLFEVADGGTIFLDEIGEMSPMMQVKLLRVLQEGQFRPVGCTRTRHVNVRLIASTNKNLLDEVARGTFREDLYYRINVFQITPPPLRERKEDIPLLASHFLKKYSRKKDKPEPRVSPAAMDLLLRFNWPGNVRELENEMERALTMAAGSTIITEDFLTDKIRRLRSGDEPTEATTALKHVVRRVERRLIREALEKTGGNRSQAAQYLGLSRQGLLNKMAAYQI